MLQIQCTYICSKYEELVKFVPLDYSIFDWLTYMTYALDIFCCTISVSVARPLIKFFTYYRYLSSLTRASCTNSVNR